MAHLAKTSYLLPELKSGKEQKESFKKHEAAFQALLDASDKVDIDNGEVVGLVYSFPYADGQANYLVVKSAPLTLQHIRYFDAWQLPYVHIKGISKQDILSFAKREQKLPKLKPMF